MSFMTPCFRFYPTFTMHVFVVFSLANVAFTGLFFSLFITFSMQIFSDHGDKHKKKLARDGVV